MFLQSDICQPHRYEAIWNHVVTHFILTTIQGANWLMGHAHIFFANDTGIPHRNWNNSIPNEGLIRYKFWLNFERVYLTQPKTLSEVLVTKSYDFAKPPFAKAALGPVLGNAILFAEGHEHKVQHKALMPAFSYRHIKELYPLFWDKARLLVNTISEDIQTKNKERPDMPANAIEVQDWASRATLDIIGIAGTGHEFNSIQDPGNELAEVYKRVLNPDRTASAINLAGQFIPSFLLQMLPLQRNKTVAETRPIIKRTCLELINKKRAKLEKGERDLDVLSAALESSHFTDDELTEQMVTMLAAGHETTAAAMTWAMYIMCQRPAMQARLRAEIQAQLPSISDPTTSIKAEDIHGLKYLQAICNEVLRYWSPIAMTMRIATKDVTVAGTFFPKGTYFVLVPNAVNHSEKLWGSDATEFDEERWLKEGQANKGGADSNYSFLSFLHGPRSCIGQNFARGEFAVLLAAWVGRFECEFVDPAYKPGSGGGVSSKPTNALWVKVKEVGGDW